MLFFHTNMKYLCELLEGVVVGGEEVIEMVDGCPCDIYYRNFSGTLSLIQVLRFDLRPQIKFILE